MSNVIKIKYVKDASFMSNGVEYIKDLVVSIDDTIGKQLLSNFPSFFELVQDVAKATPKAEVKDEPKAETLAPKQAKAK